MHGRQSVVDRCASCSIGVVIIGFNEIKLINQRMNKRAVHSSFRVCDLQAGPARYMLVFVCAFVCLTVGFALSLYG
jgi:hypothetical protein